MKEFFIITIYFISGSLNLNITKEIATELKKVGDKKNFYFLKTFIPKEIWYYYYSFIFIIIKKLPFE